MDMEEQVRGAVRYCVIEKRVGGWRTVVEAADGRFTCNVRVTKRGALEDARRYAPGARRFYSPANNAKKANRAAAAE